MRRKVVSNCGIVLSAAIAALSLCVAGCGQKGQLYLPEENPDVVTRPAQTTTTPPQPEKPDEDTTAPKAP
jgi:predicted small lipoprotein YifL